MIQLVTYGQPPYLPNGQGMGSQNKVSAEEQPTDFLKIDSPPIAQISVKNHLQRKSRKKQICEITEFRLEITQEKIY